MSEIRDRELPLAFSSTRIMYQRANSISLSRARKCSKAIVVSASQAQLFRRIRNLKAVCSGNILECGRVQVRYLVSSMKLVG